MSEILKDVWPPVPKHVEAKVAQLEARVAALREDAKFVYDDLKMRSVDGVVPISHSAWEKICRMAALIQEGE